MEKLSEKKAEHHNIHITIEDTPFVLHKERVSGAELRGLPTPHVAENRDLWLEVPGPHDDILVKPTDELELKSGMHFYTAPSKINPG